MYCLVVSCCLVLCRCWRCYKAKARATKKGTESPTTPSRTRAGSPAEMESMMNTFALKSEGLFEIEATTYKRKGNLQESTHKKKRKKIKSKSLQRVLDVEWTNTIGSSSSSDDSDTPNDNQTATATAALTPKELQQKFFKLLDKEWQRVHDGLWLLPNFTAPGVWHGSV